MSGQLSIFLCLILVMAASTNDYANDWDQEVDFNCPYGQVISSISSIYHRTHKDRRWRFGCKEAGVTYDCYHSAWVNYIDPDVNFKCPTDQVMTGVGSVHNNHEEDRTFKYRCCNVLGREPINCRREIAVNAVEKEMIFNVPVDQAIQGTESIYNKYYHDRIWHITICTLKASNLTNIQEIVKLVRSSS